MKMVVSTFWFSALFFAVPRLGVPQDGPLMTSKNERIKLLRVQHPWGYTNVHKLWLFLLGIHPLCPLQDLPI